MRERPPIVTVLGHVDHGKTTLLDTIRKTGVAAREAGGITQSIGASKITTKEGSITFIDTPGHAAFRQMRAHGARVADIAVLVVAADDGPMPQTKEALKYLIDSKTPFVVALTKVDLPGSNIEKATSELEKEGILFEGRGGDTPKVEVSARLGKGIEELLEMIFLLAEVNGLKGEKEGHLEAVIIEANKDKRGATVSVIVKSGILKVGQDIVAGSAVAKIRGLFDSNDKPVREVAPGDPALLLGFSELPPVGTGIFEKAKESIVKVIPAEKMIIKKAGEDELGIVLKAGSLGSLDALRAALPEKVIVLGESVGEVTESDVFFAKSIGAQILVFQSKTPPGASKLAETEGVHIHEFKIIYELLKFTEEGLDKKIQKVLGSAKIMDTFPFSGKLVAGCKIIEGKITVGTKVELLRGEMKLGDVRIKSIRKGKTEVSEVGAGVECGILFAPQLDFQIGDVLVSARK